MKEFTFFKIGPSFEENMREFAVLSIVILMLLIAAPAKSIAMSQEVQASNADGIVLVAAAPHEQTAQQQSYRFIIVDKTTAFSATSARNRFILPSFAIIDHAARSAYSPGLRPGPLRSTAPKGADSHKNNNNTLSQARQWESWKHKTQLRNTVRLWR